MPVIVVQRKACRLSSSKRQTGRKAGAQSCGPIAVAIGSRAAERVLVSAARETTDRRRKVVRIADEVAAALGMKREGATKNRVVKVR